MNTRRDGNTLQTNFAQELSAIVKHLGSSIAAIRHVHVPLGVNGDRMRIVKLTLAFAKLAELADGLAIFVEDGDARIYIAVADECVSVRIPGYVGRLPEIAFGWRRKIRRAFVPDMPSRSSSSIV